MGTAEEADSQMIATAANPGTERDALISVLARMIVGFTKHDRDLAYPLEPDSENQIQGEGRSIPLSKVVAPPTWSAREVRERFKVGKYGLGGIRETSPMGALRSLLWRLRVVFVPSDKILTRTGKVYGGLHFAGSGWPSIYLPRFAAKDALLTVTKHELEHAFDSAEGHLRHSGGRHEGYEQGGASYYKDSAEVQTYIQECIRTVVSMLEEMADRSTSVFKALRMEFEEARKSGTKVDLSWVKQNARSMQAARTAIIRILKTRRGFIRECLSDDHAYGKGFIVRVNSESERQFLSHIRPIMEIYLDGRWEDLSDYDRRSCEFLDRHLTEAWEDLKNRFQPVVTASLPPSFAPYIES